MRTRLRLCVIALALAIGAHCASAPATEGGREPVSPADLVASIADVAAGRNAAMGEAGLVLKTIEFKLAVGRETRGGVTLEILLLDAEASRSSETAFLQEFTLEVPAQASRSVAERPLVPGVKEFIDAAMNTARDIARATAREGLPQRIRSVELTAKLTRSRRAGGGIAATIPLAIQPKIGIEGRTAIEESNTVRLVFQARG